MTPLTCFLIGIAVAFFQGSLDVAWTLGGPPPDLLLVYVLWLGFHRRTSTALLVAFFGGLVQDSVAYHHAMGVQSLCKLAVAYLPEWTHYVLVPDSRSSGLVLGAAATILDQVLILTIVQTFEPGGVWGWSVLGHTALLLIWNLLVWILIADRIGVERQAEAIP